MEARLTYEEIRRMAMESAYESCRSAFKTNLVKNYSIEKIFMFGHFFDETYEAFDYDLDELMWRTLELILWRGIAPPGVLSRCTRIIKGILSRNDFEDLVAKIPPEEARQLHIDLVLLEFLPDPDGWRHGGYHR
jgi:hypothetical protein